MSSTVLSDLGLKLEQQVRELPSIALRRQLSRFSWDKPTIGAVLGRDARDSGCGCSVSGRCGSTHIATKRGTAPDTACFSDALIDVVTVAVSRIMRASERICHTVSSAPQRPHIAPSHEFAGGALSQVL